MNFSKRIRTIAVVAAVVLAGTITVYAAYDSSKDPIVSLSYLTDVFKPEVKGELSTALKAELAQSVNSAKNSLSEQVSSDVSTAKNEIKAELKSELEAKIEADYSATIDAMQTQLDALSNVYEAVTLEKGQRLKANAACEIVLLSGSATIRSSAADSGIIDCTDGVILYDGQSAPANHKLLVPDNGDGRGVSCTGKAQLLVKGGYTVEG